MASATHRHLNRVAVRAASVAVRGGGQTRPAATRLVLQQRASANSSYSSASTSQLLRRFSAASKVNPEGSHDDFAAIRREYTGEGGEGGDSSNNAPMSAVDEIKALIQTKPVVLFMKGQPNAPRCGFSGLVSQILAEEGVVWPQDMAAVDILSPEQGHLREEIKKFSEWPTIPQVYLNGEFVGGADIMKSLFESGELTAMIKEAKDAHASG